MIYLQIFVIAIGVLMIIIAVLNYFFHPKSVLFIWKRITEYLGENERIKYQKAQAIPVAIFGILIIISAVFFIDSDISSKIWTGSYFVWLVWTAIINKIYLGYFSPWSIPKKIF
ncbi:MAG: hypothetical protein FWF92_04530 [Oscillospiraceae bacterium]|nr:hypothetical protein [Oscillospiraceae bacterium]